MVDTIDETSGNMLASLLNSWNDHKTSMQMIKDILMYMDRVYVPTNNVDPVEILGIKVFKEQIIEYQKIKDTIRQILLKRVDEDRNGEPIEQKHEIKAAQSSFIDLNDTDMIYSSKKVTNSPTMEFKRGG